MGSELVEKAYKEFIETLFGSVDEDTDINELEVTREEYTRVMKDIQKKYGLKQGHPDFIEWLFTMIGKSPTIIEDEEEGAGYSESTTTA